MKTIWKFVVPENLVFSITLPKYAQILCVKLQHGFPHMWALVENENPQVDRHFKVYGTGDPIDDTAARYVATYLSDSGTFVWHLFEVTPS